mmetsp:Transcript_20793/g.54166  ORF Transcript_20793/g.54166 Transcript_20793/m.54166 type:complete len:237 (-) Transcript_20793:2526-3236(-)
MTCLPLAAKCASMAASLFCCSKRMRSSWYSAALPSPAASASRAAARSFEASLNASLCVVSTEHSFFVVRTRRAHSILVFSTNSAFSVRPVNSATSRSDLALVRMTSWASKAVVVFWARSDVATAIFSCCSVSSRSVSALTDLFCKSKVWAMFCLCWAYVFSMVWIVCSWFLDCMVSRVLNEVVFSSRSWRILGRATFVILTALISTPNRSTFVCNTASMSSANSPRMSFTRSCVTS